MSVHKFVLLIFLAFSSAVFAQDQGQVEPVASGAPLRSEFLYQTPAGALELTPIAGFTTQRTEYKTATYKLVSSVFSVRGSAEYGVAEWFSIGADLGYGLGSTSIEDCPSSSVCSSDDIKGLYDPSLEANFRAPVGPGALRFTLDFSTALEDSKESADGDTNLASGGNTLSASLGYEMNVGQHVFGLAYMSDVYQSDREVSDKSSTPEKYKVSDGKDWAIGAFYECHLPKLTIGGSLEYLKSEETNNVVNGTKTSNDDEYETIGFTGFVPIYLNERVTLLPRFSAFSVDYKKATTVKSSTIGGVAFGARFTF